jgi:hypothetical protein
MNSVDIIKYAAQGDAAQAKEAINDLLSSFALDALDARKKEVAQNLFKQEVPETE